jgi:uncharacterized protein YqeY
VATNRQKEIKIMDYYYEQQLRKELEKAGEKITEEEIQKLMQEYDEEWAENDAVKCGDCGEKIYGTAGSDGAGGDVYFCGKCGWSSL